MEEVIVSCFVPFLFLLFYIQVTLEAPVPPPTKAGLFCGSKITVKQIFTDNHNWDRYCLLHLGEIRAVERRWWAATDRGYFVYQCPKCGSQMEFVEFFKKDPPVIPEKWEFGTKLDDWNYLCAS